MGLRAFLKRVFGGAPESKPEVTDFDALREQWKGEVLEQLREHEERKRVFTEKVATINITKPVERLKPPPAPVPDVAPADPRRYWSPLTDPRFPVEITEEGHWIWQGGFANRNSNGFRTATLGVYSPENGARKEYTATRYAYEKLHNVKLTSEDGKMRSKCRVRDCVNPDHHSLDRPNSAPTPDVPTPDVPVAHIRRLEPRKPRITFPAVMAEIRLHVTEAPNGCMRWTGHMSGNTRNTPLLFFRGRNFRVRRIMYMFHRNMNFGQYKEVPNYVIASCGNPWCVAPEHVRGYTQEEKDFQCALAREARVRKRAAQGQQLSLPGPNGKDSEPVNQSPEFGRRQVSVIPGTGVVDNKKKT